MNPTEKQYLQNMIKENNVEDNTFNIRQLKHSQDIKRDVIRINLYNEKFKNLKITQPELFYEKLKTECFFLYNNYNDIFNKLKEGTIDVSLLLNFVNILEKIENSQLDQHEASYEVGKILKSIYIDSELRKSGKMDENNIELPDTPPQSPKVNISWKQYKKTL